MSIVRRVASHRVGPHNRKSGETRWTASSRPPRLHIEALPDELVRYVCHDNPKYKSRYATRTCAQRHRLPRSASQRKTDGSSRTQPPHVCGRARPQTPMAPMLMACRLLRSSSEGGEAAQYISESDAKHHDGSMFDTFGWGLDEISLLCEMDGPLVAGRRGTCVTMGCME